MPSKPRFARPLTTAKEEVDGNSSRTILIAVTGLSPAVLTETVWALAKDKAQPIIPDTIIVLTTLTGEQRLKEQLFGTDNLWLEVRKQILGRGHADDPRLDFATTPDRLRVFTRRRAGVRVSLDRMDTLEETEAVGDCLVEELWNWIGRPDTRVLASISGGFKTMSALLYAAMTVLGHPADRILHVLVKEPYDGGTDPLFFWPRQPRQKLMTTRASSVGPKGTELNAVDAAPILTDVQFPALRQLFGDYGFKEAPTFGNLVARCRAAVDNIPTPAVERLCLVRANLTLQVNGETVDVSKGHFYMLLFLAECASERTQFERADDCNQAYCEFLLHEHRSAPAPHRAFIKERLDVVTKEVKANDAGGGRFTKTLSALRTALAQRGGIHGKALAKYLPAGKSCLTLSADSISIE
ncbi:MAG: CRISPR-associated ring nuclease Csm6 [Verrucomicrobia bacterium]|nr:CRISPR-associated ring nuclease Csm6 [Verrucomicrobiota bacterium]